MRALSTFPNIHTHRLDAPAGEAIISLPREALLQPASFALCPDCFYSAGIHPWWTEREEDVAAMLEGLRHWLDDERVIAVGECGLDRLRGAALAEQERIFLLQVNLAAEGRRPVIVHCVRAFDRLLHLRREFPTDLEVVIHGFRGAPPIARQLLAAGFSLSFGRRRNEESVNLTPPSRRFFETDEE